MIVSQTFKSIIAETICESKDSYLVEQIVNHFSTPLQLIEATEEELMRFRGIGRVRAKQLCASVRLARLINMPVESVTIIRSPRDIFDLLREKIGYETREHFAVVFLSTKNHVIGVETISIGNLNSAIVCPREVYKSALRRSACSIVVAHCHPSGCTEASPQDLEVTARLKAAGTIMNVELIDHVILTASEYTSLKECGHL